MGCHPTAESGQVGDQHEEVCGYIWIFHTLLRSLKLSVKLLKCMANMFLFLILILSLVLWGNAVLNAPINKGEYQLNGDKTRVDSTTTGHFGTSLFGATHTFSCCSFHEFPMFKSCTSLWRWSNWASSPASTALWALRALRAHYVST